MTHAPDLQELATAGIAVAGAPLGSVRIEALAISLPTTPCAVPAGASLYADPSRNDFGRSGLDPGQGSGRVHH